MEISLILIISRLMNMIKRLEYKGILAIEWEGSSLEPVPGVLASKKLIETIFGVV